MSWLEKLIIAVWAIYILVMTAVFGVVIGIELVNCA